MTGRWNSSWLCQGQCLIVAHQPELAAELTARRDAHIAELETEAARLTGKLDGQDGGRRYKGRQLLDSGAKGTLLPAVCEAKLAWIIKVDLKSDLFTYDIDERALARARMMDGKHVLVTNVPDLTAADVVARYKALADIERNFRVLKSEIDIAPVFHRLPNRIRAHALICFLALVLCRVLRMRPSLYATGWKAKFQGKLKRPTNTNALDRGDAFGD